MSTFGILCTFIIGTLQLIIALLTLCLFMGVYVFDNEA